MTELDRANVIKSYTQVLHVNELKRPLQVSPENIIQVFSIIRGLAYLSENENPPWDIRLERNMTDTYEVSLHNEDEY